MIKQAEAQTQPPELVVEDAPDFYLPCLLAVLAHLDRPMSEAALRSRVSDPEAGWTWDLVDDTLQSLGLSVQTVPCTLELLTQAVEPVLVKLNAGGCAALLPCRLARSIGCAARHHAPAGSVDFRRYSSARARQAPGQGQHVSR